MTSFRSKTYWLIGASEGLGREVAKQLAQSGAHVIASARSESRLQSLAAEVPNVTILPLDVTSSADVSRAARAAGEIDGVIYAAGTYDPMHVADWNTDTALRMVDVNFNGALRVLGEVIPEMRSSGAGDVTLVGSLAGYRGLPAAIGYGASKSALQSLAETLRFDLRGSGVTVRIVNPGFIDTRLTKKNGFSMPQLMAPEKAASRVLRAMRNQRFRTDFPFPFSGIIKLLQYLPDWLVYRGK